ncbi:hypothetical protein [Tropicibacter naphthalenivorans]|uniref:Uncharacterized protein n=1 Tax=Tropicibacter naphthalenivorans TaxID=441103 RepID=A0A0N7LZ42_9RHOB|nr:hypothetical protein [Tropicibacter naphthalenivorans]CUH76617.1 hypothetical protein TRN7648_01030 [Tropicibacter naphthalenivorans]SMC64541.1 hypothetical protein SAMN04488093_102588 [Tropicibacter naphthalenivorans]
MLLRRASVDLQNMARALAGEVDSLLVAELMMLSSRLESKV